MRTVFPSVSRTAAAGCALTLVVALGAGTALATPIGAGTPRPAGPHTVTLSPTGTYATGIFDASAAEIVAHDPTTQRLFVVNAAQGSVDVLDASDATRPTKLFSLETAGVRAADGSVVEDGGAANSVAVRDGIVAIAVEAVDKTAPGWLVLADVDGTVLNALRVGALPDNVTFTPDGRTLLVGNEGEPAEDYSVDPEGSVSLIDLGRGKGTRDAARLTQDDVRTATFHAWDEGARTLDPAVRVFGPTVTPERRISENLEPEYITVDARSRTAHVILQEANAFATLDIAAGAFTDITPFGAKDHSLPGNGLDVSDRDGAITITTWPVKGLYQPDGAASYTVRGQTLLVTPNEGDARAWAGYDEESRFRAWSDGKSVCAGSPLATWLATNDRGIRTLDELRDNAHLGRLTVTTSMGYDEANDCLSEVYSFGGRSFSIWTADGRQLFDSGDDPERIIAEQNPAWFNSNHRENSLESRSDDKGPEPEHVAIGEIRGRTYAFVGLERIGGVMTYDITDPRNVFFVDYTNHRNVDAEPGTPASLDQGAEGLTFIAAKDSPTGAPLLAVANEVSGTTTLFTIDVTTTRGKRGR